MAADSVALDQGNRYLQLLMSKSDNMSDVDSDKDEGDVLSRKSSMYSSETSVKQFQDENNNVSPGDEDKDGAGVRKSSLKSGGRVKGDTFQTYEDDSDDEYYKTNSRAIEGLRSKRQSVTSLKSGKLGEENFDEERRISYVSETIGTTKDRSAFQSNNEEKKTSSDGNEIGDKTCTYNFDDGDDDDVVEDDEEDEDEDAIPGLARAHLEDDEEGNSEEASDGEGDEDKMYQAGNLQPDNDGSDKPAATHEPSTEAKLANPDVMGVSEKMDELRDIGVNDLDKLKKLNRNDPVIRRLMVRPRLTMREVKTVRLDPDIKAMVDDFLRTNITGDFTVGRVLRENYASFHPWLASHIQAERNAWAVRMRQSMEAGEHARRDRLQASALLVEAGLRLRELVQVCSGHMYGHPRNKQQTGQYRPKGLIGGLKEPERQHRINGYNLGSLSHRPQHAEPAGSRRVHEGAGMSRSPRRAGAAAGIFRLNGLAKASVTPEFEPSTLEETERRTALVRLIAERDEALGLGRAVDLTPSPMNMIRVEDTMVDNYESDPGTYLSTSDPSFSVDRHRRRRGKRELHEGYLDSKRSNITNGATSNNLNTSSIYNLRSNKDSYQDNYRSNQHYNKSVNNKTSTAASAWTLLDLDTLIEREFGSDDDGQTQQNTTDWPAVVRGSLEVLTDLCRTLITERHACLDILGYNKQGSVAGLEEALEEYTRNTQANVEDRRSEMKVRLEKLEDENRSLQAEMYALQKTLADTNGDALNLRRQLARLEAMVGGELPTTEHKCVGTADDLPAFLPKPRILRANGTIAHNKSNKKSVYNNAFLAAAVVYSGAQRNHLGKMAIIRGDKCKLEKEEASSVKAAHQVFESTPKLDSGELPYDAKFNQIRRKSEMSVDGLEDGEKQSDTSITSKTGPAVAVVVPQIRLGLPSRERSLVEISTEKLHTLKQRAQKLEDSLQDAISSMATMKRDDDTTSTTAASVAAKKTATINGKVPRPHSSVGERPSYWTEASFEVNGSSPTHKHDKSNHDGGDQTVNGRAKHHNPQGKPTVIKRPSDYTNGGNTITLPAVRRAASETLPFTFEAEKSSMLSGRAVPLSTSDLMAGSPRVIAARSQQQQRKRASPASVVSFSSSTNEDSSVHKAKTNGDNIDTTNTLKSRSDKPKTTKEKKAKEGDGGVKEFRSSFFANGLLQASGVRQGDNSYTIKASDIVSTSTKKVISRPKANRVGGIVAKCLRCQKLFNSVDNHKLACCYHPKVKARFEQYDSSGRLTNVVHAWQCCKQSQDADGCCYGQHV